MADASHHEALALISLAETARGVFDFLLTIADDVLEQDPAMSVRCLYCANKLADAANRALRAVDPTHRDWIPSVIERDRLESETPLTR